MAYPANTVQYISSVKYAAVTAWATGAAKSVGDRVRQNSTPAVGSERVFVCIVAGTTHATTEPTWSTSRGAKTTDNTVTWQECTGSAAMNGDDDNTPTWLQNKNVLTDLGQIIKNNAGSHYFICTTAGTTGNGAEPSFSTTTGNTTADNTVTWTCLGAAPSAFGNWASPHARIGNALTTNWATNNGFATDVTKFYVGSDNAETQASTMSWATRGTQAAPIDIVCVDVAGSVPPVSADVKTTPTATVTTTSSASMSLAGVMRVCSGIIFSCGTSSNVTLTIASDSNADKNFENCNFTLGSGTGSGASFAFGRTLGRTRIKNAAFKFGNAGQGFQNGGPVEFENCTIDSGGSTPTTFIQATVAGSDFIFTGCDLSLITGTFISNSSNAATSRYGFFDCKVATSFTPITFAGASSGNLDQVTFSRCANGASPLQYLFAERSGTTQSTSTVYRHDGATENSTPFGWQVITTANSNNGNSPHVPATLGKYNVTVGSDITATIYGVYNGAALPTNEEIWLEVEYLGTASSVRGVIKDNRVANFIVAGSAHSADTSDWDDGVTARANATAYVVGDVRKVATNTGRIFICTTAGTSAGSEPGGYASAVDGGSVTDGTAVFRAGMRFSMAVTINSTPSQVQVAGMIYGKVKVGKLSSTYYIDPELVLT